VHKAFGKAVNGSGYRRGIARSRFKAHGILQTEANAIVILPIPASGTASASVARVLIEFL
jgi:hypothetical protein